VSRPDLHEAILAILQMLLGEDLVRFGHGTVQTTPEVETKKTGALQRLLSDILI
jgi:hypothetical protein